MRLSSRLTFVLAVLLLLVASATRTQNITLLPPGYSDDEINNIRLVEYVRAGNISVFYDLGDNGQEGLYHVATAMVTGAIGNSPLGYRMFSVWANLIALALVYAVGKRLMGNLAGLAALVLLTFSMWPLLLSRHITPITVLPFLVTVILLCLSLVLPVYRRRRRRGDNTTAAAALGLFLGVSLYVHPISLLIILASVIFIGMMLRFRRKKISNRRISYLGFAITIIIIISMPYVISYIRIPQLGGMERITGQAGPPSIQSALEKAGDAISGLVTNGDQNPEHNLPGRALFDPISMVLIVLGLGTAIYYRKEPRYALILIFLIILSPVFLFATNAPDFRNYTTLLPIFALLFGLGMKLVTSLLPRYGNVVALGILFALAGWNLNQLSTAFFEDWAQSPQVATIYNKRLGDLARYIDASSDDIPTVICGWSVNTPPLASLDFTTPLTSSQIIQLMLHSNPEQIRLVDCYNNLVLTNGGERQQIIIPDEDVLQSAHPIIQDWLERGEFLRASSIPQAGVLLLDVEALLADRMGEFTVSTPVRYAPEAGGSNEETFGPPVSFGNNLTFLGYIPEDVPNYSPGGIVTLVTYWRIQEGVVPPDLTLFTHILADPGASPPANTDIINLDPSYLRTRDVFAQVTYVPLPESLPAGTYAISIGAYQDSSKDRLNVLEDGQERGTRLFLYDIIVTEPSS